jgi:hypothetical protein
VLEPLGASGGTAGYFLYEHVVAYYDIYSYSPNLLVGTINKTSGYIDEIAEQILPTPPGGAGGTGKLVTLGFRSKSLTAYSPIQIGLFEAGVWEANWMNTTIGWNNVEVIDGHYNEPPTGWIDGTVIDNATALPIVGATVTATPGDYSDIADGDGNYTIADLSHGNYTVTVSADGYESDSKSATIVAGQTTTVDFELTPTPSPGTPWYLYAGAVGAVAILVVIVAFYFLRIKKPKPT